MMKLSTKGRYGVSAIYDIALNSTEGPVSMRSVAERQMISDHYLEQLMVHLRRAGFVKSVRGAQGGYTLAKSPKEITVGDIIRVMEGPIAPVDCLLSGASTDKYYCPKSGACVTRSVWERVGSAIENLLDGITIEDLIKEHSDEKK